jgi:hypothetical protein
MNRIFFLFCSVTVLLGCCYSFSLHARAKLWTVKPVFAKRISVPNQLDNCEVNSVVSHSNGNASIIKASNVRVGVVLSRRNFDIMQRLLKVE